MYMGTFLKGLGIGMAAGAVAGVAITADKKKIGIKAGRVVRAIGEIAGGVIKAIEG